MYTGRYSVSPHLYREILGNRTLIQGETQHLAGLWLSVSPGSLWQEMVEIQQRLFINHNLLTIMNTQTWKDIPGFVGKYQVSDLGKVRSIVRTSDGYEQIGKELKGNTTDHGYQRVILTKSRLRSKHYYVHRLVAITFLGDYTADELEVAHNDGNKLNNKLENLRWTTSKDNSADQLRHGTRNQGEKHGCAKLTAKDVTMMRGLRGLGATLQYIADLYGISNSHCHRIISGQAWSHV